MTNTIPFRSLRDTTAPDPLSGGQAETTRSGGDWAGVQLYQGSVPGWSVKDLYIDGHAILLNMNDEKIVFHANERPYHMAPLGLLFVPAGTAISSEYHHPFRFCMMVIDRQQFSLDAGIINPSMHCIEELQDPFLVHLVQSLVLLAREERSNTHVISDIRRSVVLRILNISGDTHSTTLKGGLAMSHLKKVLAYVDEHLGEHLTIDVLAELVDLSPTHFARAFRESTGLPPHRYITGLRLDRARIVLQQPDSSLAEVAVRFGFSDHSHFTRLFKERFGITPSAYRKI